MAYPPTLAVPGSRNDNNDETEAMLNADDYPISPATQAREDEMELEEFKRYEDFSTVDWIQDSLRERNRKAPLPRPGSISDRLNHLDGAAGWLWRSLSKGLQEGEAYVIITLVGIGIGLSSALMSIMTGWLADIKLGRCSTGWWLSRKFCCLEISDEDTCEEWHQWGAIQPFPWISYVIYAGVFAFAAAYLVRNFAPYAAGSGISEIKCILSGFIINGYLGFETFVIKALTLPLSIGSGLAVGKEGPSVHVACCVGNIVSGLFPRYKNSQLKRREILTAASAAGVAVAFGSPIGGVLFSIEEMNPTYSTRTMWRSFVCALVATFTLASLDPFRTGKLVLFQVSYDRDWHYFEIPAYIVLGIFGGCYGAFVSKFNLQVAAFRRKHLAKHGVMEAVILATFTGFIGYLNRFLRIDMTESMSILFRECEGGGDNNGLCQASSQWSMVNSLLLATILRIGFVIISYGSKVPAGIFVPSMAVGATFGRMVGILVKAMQVSYPNAPWFVGTCQPDAPCITPGTYAFLGAGAALGGITGLTVTVVVIMFELTGALTYLLPTMIVVLVTKAVSEQINKGGIADQMIRFNGFPFLEKDDAAAGAKTFFEPIAHIMRQDVVVMPSTGIPLQQVSELVQSTDFQGFPVVKSPTDRTIIGFVRKNELRYALDRARRTRQLANDAVCTFQAISEDSAQSHGLSGAEPDIVLPAGEGRARESRTVDFGQYIDETPLTVSPKMPLEIVLQLFRRMGPRIILVAREGQLVGLVTIKDVLRHEATEKHRENTTQSHTRLTSWDGEWAPMPGDERQQQQPEQTGPSLENLLEDALQWAQTHGVSAVNDVISRVRNTRTVSGSSIPPRNDDAYRFDMDEERAARH